MINRGRHCIIIVKWLAGAFLIPLLPMIGGCATIMHGGGEDVMIMSEPPGARVRIDTLDAGETPLSITLYRNADHSVRVEKPGYHAVEYVVTHSVSNWVVGNFGLSLLFPVGFVVDFAGGGSQNLNVDKLYVQLKPVEEP